MATKTKKRLIPESHRGDPLYEYALWYVNFLRRRKLRLAPLEQLPRGLQGSDGEDPIARALGARTRIGRDGYSQLPTPEGGIATYATPHDLGRFLDAFERGTYPALIAPR